MIIEPSNYTYETMPDYEDAVDGAVEIPVTGEEIEIRYAHEVVYDEAHNLHLEIFTPFQMAHPERTWPYITFIQGSAWMKQVILSAIIVLRKNATVKVLDFVVPVMAVCYFFITLFIIAVNFRQIPSVFARIFEEAFGLRQMAAGGFGAVLMNGVKRGLFSNEAGSGSAPCAAAAAECDRPAKAGLVQALGVFVDTIVICSCTAMIMLLAPKDLINGLSGMDLLQTAMQYHLGKFGVIFIALTLFLFSFSTFLGILFYARCNVAYLFGDKWCFQTAYKVLALVMLFIGGIAAYTFVWDLGDVGIGLMTIFNIIALYPLAGEALSELKSYEESKKS